MSKLVGHRLGPWRMSKDLGEGVCVCVCVCVRVPSFCLKSLGAGANARA